jgi:hypothetical protein
MCDETRSEMSAATLHGPVENATLPFTCQQWLTLLQLRHRYQQSQDLWNDRELAHLRFLRWLCQTGRLEP